MNQIYGVSVIVAKDRPGYVLSLDVPVTPKFRAEFNAWAAAFFKPKPSVLADNQVIHDNVHNVLHMNQRTFDKLQRELCTHNITL